MVFYWIKIRILCSLLLTWFDLLITVKGFQDAACFGNCNCCIDKVCQNLKCTTGCIDRHRGGKCYNLCKYNCSSCDDNINKCTKCYEGFYLGPKKDCRSECPRNCKSCISDTVCLSCKEGFLNKDGSTTCQHECSVGCKGNSMTVTDLHYSRITTAVLVTLLALSATAWILYIVIMIYRKMRLTQRRKPEEVAFRIENQTQRNEGGIATSDAYESIENVQDDMANVGNTNYMYLHVQTSSK